MTPRARIAFLVTVCTTAALAILWPVYRSIAEEPARKPASPAVHVDVRDHMEAAKPATDAPRPPTEATPEAVMTQAPPVDADAGDSNGFDPRGGTTNFGACCYDGGCFETFDIDCEAVGGVFMGNNTTCADNDGDGVADICETQEDCNTNGVPDADDIASQGSLDTNGNGIPDECERDCNTNGVSDDVDISVGQSQDQNQDGIPDECCFNSVTYTSMADFNQGYLYNLEHVVAPGTTDDCLKLSDELRAWPFIGVANSGRDTLVRIDINSGDVVGEYLTRPNGMWGNPSRTTGDQFGNIWVTNRDEAGFVGGNPKGSVTRIGLVVGGTRGDVISGNFSPNPLGDYLQGPFSYCTCSDKDGDGFIKTSRGYPQVTGTTDYQATFLPWPNTASADSNGGVSTAEDECITAYVRVAGTGTRFLGIDPAGDIWTGGWFNSEFEKINAATATVVPLSQFNSTCGGYGGLVDKTNVIWSAPGLLRHALPGGPNQCLSIPAYGVAIDPLTNHIWTSAGPDVYEVSPAGAQLNFYSHGGFSSQGLVVDRNSTVWVAHSLGATVNTVGRLLTNGTFVGNVDLDTNPSTTLGRGPTGVAVDGNDKIWSTNYWTNNAMRIDPTIGVTGAVDLVVDLGSGATPYNYSDMTGSVLIQAVAPQGNWTVIHDSGIAGFVWKIITWTAMLDPGTSITVQVRASNNPLPSGPWTVVGNGIPFTGVVGRYLQVQVILKRPPKSMAQVKLCDITLCGDPPACLIVTKERAQCSTQAPNQVWYRFDLTNNSTFPITHLFLVPDAPIVISPNHIVLGSPLLPTQTTTIVLPYPPGLTLSNMLPTQPPFDLFISAHDANFSECCVLRHRVDFDLDCGPGACCRPCSIGGGCFNAPSFAACAQVGGTFYPGINCTIFLCPLCPIDWDPVDVHPFGGVAVALAPDGTLLIDVPNPTGADGVRIDYGDSEVLSLDWASLDPNGTLPVDAELQTRVQGTFNGVPEYLIGRFAAKRKSPGIELSADFYTIGSFELVQNVQVYRNGTLVASREANPGPVAFASDWPTGVTTSRGDDPVAGMPYFSYRWDGLVQLRLPGLPPLDGDELRIVATNPNGPVQSLSSMTNLLTDIQHMTLTSASPSVPQPCAGDCTGDHVRDGEDIQRFVECLFGTPGAVCTCADMNGDGTTDQNDLGLFLAALLSGQSCP